MDLSLSDAQAQIIQTARALLDRHCTVDRVQQVRSQRLPFDAALWQQIVDAGLPALAGEIPLGLGPSLETATYVLLEMGRALAPVPLLTVFLSGLALAKFSDRSKAPVSKPDDVIAFAGGRWRTEASSFSGFEARRVGVDWRFSGRVDLVRDAQVATAFLCASLADGHLVLFPIRADAKELTVEARTTSGGHREGSLLLKEVTIGANALLRLERSQLRWLRSVSIVLSAAEAVGAAERALEMALEHAETRHQFGQPLVNFQAIRHTLVNMRNDIDACRSLLLWSAVSAGHQDVNAESLAACLAISVAEASWRVARSAHQVHGGVGYILDHPLPLYSRALKSFALVYGDQRAHADFLAERIFRSGLRRPNGSPTVSQAGPP
jgi:alkylation response protein AidB-like acyl-CoA dehydrogenase